MILLLSLTGCQSEEGGGSADPPVSGITGERSHPALDNSSAETSGTEATDRSQIERNHTESSVTESDKSPEPESSISEVTAEPSTKPPAPTKPSQPDAESEPSTPPGNISAKRAGTDKTRSQTV